jgi:peptidyl-prolyl cis-trans isomerase C
MTLTFPSSGAIEGVPALAWQAAARALVVRQLLLQEAARLGVDATPLSDQDGRTETPEEASMRALIQREVATPEPDETTCRRFYEQNSQRFQVGELYESAHILLAAAPGDIVARTAARAAADEILTAVKSDPSAFANAAREHSACRTSALEGGCLGQISRGQTVTEFESGLDRLRPGELAVVETRFGFHVVRLDQHVPGKTLPFETVRQRIADYLAVRVERRALAQYVSILAGRAEIVGISLESTGSPLVQ